MMTCPKCGIHLEPGDNYCWNCGADVRGKAQKEPKSIYSRFLLVILIVLAVVVIGICMYQYSMNELRNPFQFFGNIISQNFQLSGSLNQ